MNIKTTLAAAALLISCTLNTWAENILGIDGEESTSVGIYIKDLTTGDVLVDHNSQLALTPASVMKAVTTASALSINGPTVVSLPVYHSGALKGLPAYGTVT